MVVQSRYVRKHERKHVKSIRVLCIWKANSLACVKAKEDENECFRIDGGVGQVCTMFPWLFNVYMDAVMKEVKMVMGRRGVIFLKEWREWRLSGFLYAYDLVLCGESEEALRAMVGRFVERYRRGMKVNARKSKVTVLNRGEGL